MWIFTIVTTVQHFLLSFQFVCSYHLHTKTLHRPFNYSSRGLADHHYLHYAGEGPDTILEWHLHPILLEKDEMLGTAPVQAGNIRLPWSILFPIECLPSPLLNHTFWMSQPIPKISVSDVGISPGLWRKERKWNASYNKWLAISTSLFCYIQKTVFQQHNVHTDIWTQPPTAIVQRPSCVLLKFPSFYF